MVAFGGTPVGGEEVSWQRRDRCSCERIVPAGEAIRGAGIRGRAVGMGVLPVGCVGHDQANALVARDAGCAGLRKSCGQAK